MEDIHHDPGPILAGISDRIFGNFQRASRPAGAMARTDARTDHWLTEATVEGREKGRRDEKPRKQFCHRKADEARARSWVERAAQANSTGSKSQVETRSNQPTQRFPQSER